MVFAVLFFLYINVNMMPVIEIQIMDMVIICNIPEKGSNVDIA